MIVHSHWKVWTAATTIEKALRVVHRVLKLLDSSTIPVTVEPYHKGGHVAAFVIEHAHERWSDTVLDVLRLAQRVGHSWEMHGNIGQAVDLWTIHVSASGVTAIAVEAGAILPTDEPASASQ